MVKVHRIVGGNVNCYILVDNVVISGLLVDWGDELIPMFTLTIRLVTDTEIRIERIKIKEKQKFGDRIVPEGDMYTHYMEFIE